jgi:hypothetical protein
MAGAGFKQWVDGDILTAGDVNTYLMDQAVMVFADAAARTTALPTPSEGMVSYLVDTNAIQYYDGSAWLNIVPNFTTFTPTFTNLTVGTGAVDFAYSIIGKMMTINGRLLFGSTTSITGNVLVTLPASATSARDCQGTLKIVDVGIANYGGYLTIISGSTNIFLLAAQVSGANVTYGLLNATTPHTWGSGDELAFSITVEIT